MRIVLIISLFVMFYITERYNTKDWFKLFFFDLLVQILHIVTIIMISLSLLAINSFVFWLISIYILYGNIKYLILNIYDTFFSKEDDEVCEKSDESNSSNDSKKER